MAPNLFLHILLQKHSFDSLGWGWWTPVLPRHADSQPADTPGENTLPRRATLSGAQPAVCTGRLCCDPAALRSAQQLWWRTSILPHGPRIRSARMVCTDTLKPQRSKWLFQVSRDPCHICAAMGISLLSNTSSLIMSLEHSWFFKWTNQSSASRLLHASNSTYYHVWQNALYSLIYLECLLSNWYTPSTVGAVPESRRPPSQAPPPWPQSCDCTQDLSSSLVGHRLSCHWFIVKFTMHTTALPPRTHKRSTGNLLIFCINPASSLLFLDSVHCTYLTRNYWYQHEKIHNVRAKGACSQREGWASPAPAQNALSEEKGKRQVHGVTAEVSAGKWWAKFQGQSDSNGFWKYFLSRGMYMFSSGTTWPRSTDACWILQSTLRMWAPA